jgi:hypothetical protein
MFKSSLILTRGTLEAECEREHQHNQTEESNRPKDEQHNYRCDRVFYVTEWLLHLLSPLFLVGARGRLCLVKGCTEDLLDRFWPRKWRPSRQTAREHKGNPSSNVPRIKLYTFLVIATETQWASRQEIFSTTDKGALVTR